MLSIIEHVIILWTTKKEKKGDKLNFDTVLSHHISILSHTLILDMLKCKKEKCLRIWNVALALF